MTWIFKNKLTTFIAFSMLIAIITKYATDFDGKSIYNLVIAASNSLTIRGILFCIFGAFMIYFATTSDHHVNDKTIFNVDERFTTLEGDAAERAARATGFDGTIEDRTPPRNSNIFNTTFLLGALFLLGSLGALNLYQSWHIFQLYLKNSENITLYASINHLAAGCSAMGIAIGSWGYAEAIQNWARNLDKQSRLDAHAFNNKLNKYGTILIAGGSLMQMADAIKL